MLNVTTDDIINEEKKEVRYQSGFSNDIKAVLKTIVLNFISDSCNGFYSKYDEAKTQAKDEKEFDKQMMTFFKFRNSTYLTSLVFDILMALLSKSSQTIHSKKTLSNLNE